MKDFEKLKPKDVTETSKGKFGTLSDGRSVNVRKESSDSRPTLEIQECKKRIKIRYGDK